MTKQFWVSVAVTFVLMLELGFLVHGLLLAGDYGNLPGLFRTQADQQRHFPFMLAAHAIAAFFFVWIYLRGKEAKPFLGQGVRYGLAMAGVRVVPKFLIYFAVQPIPHMIVWKQIVFGTVAVVVIGIVVARRVVPGQGRGVEFVAVPPASHDRLASLLDEPAAAPQ